MRHLPDGSYVTTLQRKNSRHKASGKVYLQYSAYFPAPDIELLGWDGGSEIRLRKGKNVKGKFSGWVVERYMWRCAKCGKESPGESLKCVSCGTPCQDVKPKRVSRGKRRCLQCGYRNSHDAVYCMNCGVGPRFDLPPPKPKLAERKPTPEAQPQAVQP